MKLEQVALGGRRQDAISNLCPSQASGTRTSPFHREPWSGIGRRSGRLDRGYRGDTSMWRSALAGRIHGCRRWSRSASNVVATMWGAAHDRKLGTRGAVLGVLGDREREPLVVQAHVCAGGRRRARISYAAPRRVVSARLSAGREEVAQHPLDIVDYDGAVALP